MGCQLRVANFFMVLDPGIGSWLTGHSLEWDRG